MSKWGARMIAVIILLLFIFLMSSLYKQLNMIKEQHELEHPPAAATTTNST